MTWVRSARSARCPVSSFGDGLQTKAQRRDRIRILPHRSDSRDAVRARQAGNATAAARLNSVANAKFRRGNAEKEIGRLGGYDLIMVDPPRLGLPKAVLQGIIRIKPQELIFVSCDPPTFARDAKALIEAGYILSEINLVDLFPATYHAETVAVFRRG